MVGITAVLCFFLLAYHDTFFLDSAGSMTMEVDETNSFLVTGDADGIIKVWDIAEYCVRLRADHTSPPRKFSFRSKVRILV